MGFFRKNRGRSKPRTQYWGGTADHYYDERNTNMRDVERGSIRLDRGLRKSDNSRIAANKSFAGETDRLSGLDKQQSGIERDSGARLNAAFDDYRSGRGATLANAAALENAANKAEQNYRQTSDASFRQQTDQNNRGTLALASRGGAGSLRAAIGANSQANAQAQSQAAITQAQELNQIQASREAALANAAQIRAGMASQDQNLAGMQVQRQQTAGAGRLALAGQQASNINSNANINMTDAATVTQAGMQQRGQGLDYRAAMETGQLNANRENEQQRLQNERNRFNMVRDPLGLFGAS